MQMKDHRDQRHGGTQGHDLSRCPMCTLGFTVDWSVKLILHR